MNRLVVLMYHAFYSTPAERAAIDAADRPYAISVRDFALQLDYLVDSNIPVVVPQADGSVSGAGVMLTFDDGHASNYHHAYQMLRERGFRGVFFVTSDFIGRRPGFCSWMELRQMREGGMVIGSHGRTHRFFDDLDAQALADEYGASYREIEKGCGCAPVTLSFPGGRYRTDQLATGRAAGYRLFFSSRVGVNRAEPHGEGAVLRRIAMREGTSFEQFRSFVHARSCVLWRAQVAAAVKSAARTLLGNRLYHSLYEKLSG